ncbi:hypothetical protein OH77DRAFT_1362125, partial [Trametes cingulata]
ERKTSSLFDRADADVIFRSCDGVDLRLHKLILSMASPFFADMFTLPAAADAVQNPEKEENVQVVEMAESAETLENLFAFCYPMERSDRSLGFDTARSVLHAATKFDMPFVTRPVMESLEGYLPFEPLRVYAIAYLMEDAELARDAASCLLGDPQFYDPPDPPPEFADIPATALTSVAAYRRACAEAAQDMLLDHTWMYSAASGHPVHVSRKGNADLSQAWVWLACTSCAKADAPLAVPNMTNGYHAYVSPRKWWKDYTDAVAKELALRPLGSVLTQRSLLHSALEKAAECTTCGPKAAWQLTAYAEGMSERID